MNYIKPGLLSAILVILIFSSCKYVHKNAEQMSHKSYPRGTFGYDLDFLEKRQKVVLLTSADSLSQVLVSTDFQGRVMTSTSNGLDGLSFGWMNYNAISSDSLKPHINPYGGEERFWLGPEGGQFSVYFAPGTSFEFSNWQVPAAIDTEPFDLLEFNKGEVAYEKHMKLTNYSGTEFNLKVNRSIRLLDKAAVVKILTTNISDSVEWVGYETENTITNTGTFEWTRKTGMLSVWILGMYVPSPGATVCIPYREGDEQTYGKIVTDDYFGKVPADRLKVGKGFIYLKCDGHYRSKIGLSPMRAMPFAASYDSENHVLTLLNFSLPSMHLPYVNSLWKKQEDPFSGDAVNSYNDGPVADGTQMGPFFEIENSSAAAALKPGESLTHFSRTIHFRGSEAQLNKICRQVLDTDLEKIKAAFE